MKEFLQVIALLFICAAIGEFYNYSFALLVFVIVPTIVGYFEIKRKNK